jgi:peptidoglycan/xylan/chitin deacetylase (PgdA/CDA1 family)
MKERTKDIYAGIFSIIFIGAIFYLYLVNLFGGPTFKINSDEIRGYAASEHESCHIMASEPRIILRMDDVRAYSVPAPYLIDEILSRNLTAVLGIIPYDLERDKDMRKYLISLVENPNIEIAQHGTNHDPSDANITKDSLLKGNLKLQKILGVKPVTYIPPYNRVSPASKELISEYFDILSGEDQILKEGEQMAEVGYSVSTYLYDKHTKVSINEIIDKCESDLERTNICLITIHPQEYATDIHNPGDISEEKLKEFKVMLDQLEELNVKFANLKDIVVCDNKDKIKQDPLNKIRVR